MRRSINSTSYNSLITPSITFLVGLIIYTLTLAPTISWGDSADLALRMVSTQDTTFIGSHREYKLFLSIGQFFQAIPFGDVGARANFVSAFFGAVTVALVTWIVQVITLNRTASVLAGISLIVSHSFWLLSVIAEVYTFSTTLAFATLGSIVYWSRYNAHHSKYFLLLSYGLAGFSLLHLPTGLILLVAIVSLTFIRWRQTNLANFAICLAIFFLVSHTYWNNVFLELLSGQSIFKALGLVMTQNSFYEVSPLREFFKFFAYLAYNYFGLSILIGSVGVVASIWFRVFEALPIIIWGGTFIYAGSISSIPDKFNVYIHVYPAFSVFVGLGIAYLTHLYPFFRRNIILLFLAIALIPPITYFSAVKFSEITKIDIVGARVAPLRDNNWYFLWPPKNGDYSPRLFAETALSNVSKDGILIADYTLWRPLLFIQTIDKYRTDVRLIFVERLFSEGVVNWIDRNIDDNQIFIAAIEPPAYYQLDEVIKKYQLEQKGIIYQIIPKLNSSSSLSNHP
ncbi:DUF2723 domain-containing protein [Thermosynechococcus sp. CL-1]|uniref:protein O-mannosyl-transferase family n=1 Tax=Thermosynechococcus sp. CL-1 TaxID=2583530 RepID=UPI00122E3E92|nr:DUF2723 domain-containing protein [Thermosynechococcus sp. CL-1]QEQ00680.1 DUF2723 domain-containing protein [Thermosynechococcus sp. CL-1]